MAKKALIVDDSASARLVLERILLTQQLDVDTAESGEQALAYLKEARPDVIFMDHLMPGMDGFEALTVIKRNPETATIPVMMYTAQEGELYVGQARALGAFGVLPKQVAPVEISKVLKALHLAPTRPAGGQRAMSADRVESQGAPDYTSDDSGIRDLLGELFSQQQLALQMEIREGYERLTEQATQTEPVISRDKRTLPQGFLMQVGVLVLSLIAAVFAYLYFETSAELARSPRQISTGTSEVEQLTPQEPSGGAESQVPEISPAFLGLMERAATLGGSYPFGSWALDEERAERFSVFMREFRAFGFRGALVAHVHLGRYCLNTTEDGELLLPPSMQLAAQCSQFGWSEADALSLSERRSIQFANVMAVAQGDESVAFEVIAHGSSMPRVSYPAFVEGVTAGDWNEIAAQNQRVEVELLPE